MAKVIKRKRSNEYLLTPEEKAVELLEQARLEGRQEILKDLLAWVEIRHFWFLRSSHNRETLAALGEFLKTHGGRELPNDLVSASLRKTKKGGE